MSAPVQRHFLKNNNVPHAHTTTDTSSFASSAATAHATVAGGLFFRQLKIDASKYDMKKLKEFNEQNLSKNFEDTSATGFYKKNNITISYNYTDTGMRPLYKIVFTPDKCK